MIGLLIRRHLPEWADRIDYRTLQPLPTELVDERLRRRYPDMAWRVRTTDGSADLVLLLEFQGRPERHMALRTTIYGCLAAQSLIQLLGLSGVTTVMQMRAALAVLLPLVEACEDEDLDRFMARSVKAMLRSKGFSNQQLEEAMTMSTVVTEFQRSLDDIRQEGREEVLVQQIARKFGERTAEEARRSILGSPGRDRIALVAAAILDCETREEFLERVRGD